MTDDELRTPSGRLNALYPEYERQKCFVGYAPDTSWHEDLIDACNDVLQEFNMEPWYATEYFAPTQSLREKVVEMIANTRHGLYDLSCWRKDDKGEWQVPRDVFIELGIAIALNRPLLMLRHSSNSVAELPLPQCLTGVSEQIVEFSGPATLKRKLRERLSQWQQTEPEKDWWNRYCIFGDRKCEYRETSPHLRQWGQETLHCHISDGRDVDQDDFRDVVEEVLKRFDDLTFDYLDDLSFAEGYTFLLCSHCQTVRSSPLAIYRISDQTPAETFIAIGMSLALETQFERKIPKILLTSHTEDIPSLLAGYDVMVAQNYRERKSSLSKFTPNVIHQVRKTTWKARPLPFIEVMPRSDGRPTSEEQSEQEPENEYLSMIGKYGLIKEIDRSEIAVTYLVRDTENEQIYALKRLHANFASDQRSVIHFQREAEILSQLNDPHIIRGIEQGEDGMVPYFVMEYVEGQPLRQLMRTTGAMEVSCAINYARQIAAGLDAAYQRGIIHHDLMPENILIDSQDQVKISNFGPARDVDVDERTITQANPTSSPYSMAPERFEGSRNTSIRSALYALAVLFFDMLAGRPPFTGETAVDVAVQHVNMQVPSLCRLRPDLPGVFDFFMQKAMAKSADDRYQTPGEFIAALDQLQQAASLTPPGNHTPVPVNEGALSSRGMPALVGKTLGNYRLFDYLGTRGLSDVFKAYESTSERIVAMKVFSPTLIEMPGFREVFEREMHTFAQLSHPNLIPIYDFGVQNDQPYIVQEYVDGGSLIGRLKAGLAEQKIVAYIIQAAEGLAYLHHNDLAHQDVCPENMLLRSDERLLLSNWDTLNVLKTAQVSLDTPALSAPEQEKGQPADQRSNICSLGMSLFGCLLFGQVASSTFFDRDIVGEDAEYFPIWYLRFAHVSVELQQVILKMMQEQPDDRYQSMQEVIEALKAALIVIEQELEHTETSTRGMDRCAFCNAATTPEDEVCASCGKRLLPEKPLQKTIPLSAPAWGLQTAPAYYPPASYTHDPHATIKLYLYPVCGEGLQFSDTSCPHCGYILTRTPSSRPLQPDSWPPAPQMLFCSNCGAAALPGYTYCTQCNSYLLPLPVLTNCRFCNAIVRQGDKYCMNCGRSLLSPPSAPEDSSDVFSGPVSAEDSSDVPSGNWYIRGPASRAASPGGWGWPPAADGWGSASPQPSPGNNICPYCGDATRPGDNFCLNCGNRLPAQPPREQTSDPWSAPPPPDLWAKPAPANPWDTVPSFSGWGNPPPPANPWGVPEGPTQVPSHEDSPPPGAEDKGQSSAPVGDEEAPAPSLTGQFGTAWTGSPAPISQEDLNNIGKIFGSYRILRDIGQGGLGRVYLALHTVSHQPAAVKLFYSHLDSKQRQHLFFLQGQPLDHLRHPYILPIIEVNLQVEQPYLITAYAPLGSLHDRIQSGQPLSVENAVTILSQIGEALAHIHQHNIVHRDLKPGNILFNDNNEALLSDFDIAIVLDTGDSKKMNKPWGSPPYMAPEQFGGMVSRQSDQYALGCIAYRLLTGKRPFDDSNFMALQYKHTTQEPVKPRQLNPNIPAHVELAILKAMAKNPAYRFADMMAFIAALNEGKTPPPTPQTFKNS